MKTHAPKLTDGGAKQDRRQPRWWLEQPLQGSKSAVARIEIEGGEVFGVEGGVLSSQIPLNGILNPPMPSIIFRSIVESNGPEAPPTPGFELLDVPVQVDSFSVAQARCLFLKHHPAGQWNSNPNLL